MYLDFPRPTPKQGKKERFLVPAQVGLAPAAQPAQALSQPSPSSSQLLKPSASHPSAPHLLASKATAEAMNDSYYLRTWGKRYIGKPWDNLRVGALMQQKDL